MMKPIINPWLFYLTDVLSGIKWLLVVFFAVALFVYLFGLCIYLLDMSELPDWHKLKNIVFLVIPIIIGLLIPEEKTVYKMLIASYTTSNNIEYVKETGKDLVDYIIEKANELERVQYEKDSK